MRIAHVERHADIARAMGELMLRGPRPTVVVVGGAENMDAALTARLEPVFDRFAEFAARANVAVVDGGTDAGVMRLLGRARRRDGSFPLIGVVVEELAAEPGIEPVGKQATLEPNHSHVLLVPGVRWGDEVPWLSRVASVLAGSRPSATVLVNGGEVAYADVEESVAARREVLALANTGRVADAIAAALRGVASDERSRRLAASGLVRAVELREDAGAALVSELEPILTPGR